MLAYQPVKTLTKVNVAIGQGLAAAKILPIVDMEVEIKSNESKKILDLKEGNIYFNSVNFSYKSNFESFKRYIC